MFELFVKGIADALVEALAPDRAPGRVVVLGAPRLARALHERGVDAVTVGPWSRALRRAAGSAVCAGDALPFADGSVAGAVTVGDGPSLAEASRIVHPRGTLAIVSRDPATRVTNDALNAGLLEIEQRSAGRAVIVSGRVLGPL